MWLGGGLLFGGIFALGFTVTYARSTSYSNESSVVVTDSSLRQGAARRERSPGRGRGESPRSCGNGVSDGSRVCESECL